MFQSEGLEIHRKISTVSPWFVEKITHPPGFRSMDTEPPPTVSEDLLKKRVAKKIP